MGWWWNGYGLLQSFKCDILGVISNTFVFHQGHVACIHIRLCCMLWCERALITRCCHQRRQCRSEQLSVLSSFTSKLPNFQLWQSAKSGEGGSGRSFWPEAHIELQSSTTTCKGQRPSLRRFGLASRSDLGFCLLLIDLPESRDSWPQLTGRSFSPGS